MEMLDFVLIEFGKTRAVVRDGGITFCRDYKNGEIHYYYFVRCDCNPQNAKELFNASKSFTVLPSINKIQFTIEFDELCGVDFIESKED